jgi:hypothetical protein
MIATVLRPVGAVERNHRHPTSRPEPIRASRHTSNDGLELASVEISSGAADKPEESPTNQDHRKSPVAEAFSVAGL